MDGSHHWADDSAVYQESVQRGDLERAGLKAKGGIQEWTNILCHSFEATSLIILTSLLSAAD